MTDYNVLKQKQYELEALIAKAANNSDCAAVRVALDFALDILRSQVAEYIRTAEKEEKKLA